MTHAASRRSLRSRWLPLAALVTGLTVVSLAAPGTARAHHDDWRWHHPHFVHRYPVRPRFVVGWRAPVFVAPPPPVYLVPAPRPYVVAPPPPPPVVVVPALPRIVLPIGHHGAVIFGP